MNSRINITKDILEVLDNLLIPWMVVGFATSSNKKKGEIAILGMSEQFAEEFGFKKSDIVNQPIQVLYKKGDNKNQKKLFKNILNTEKTKFTVSLPLNDYEITRHNISGTGCILTSLKSTHDNVPEYPLIEKKFRSIFNALGDFIFITGFNGRFLEVNDTALQILAYSREDFLKLTPRDVSVSRDIKRKELPATAFEEYDEWAQSEELLFGAELLSREGKRIPIEARSKIITYDGKEAILTIARDITERAMFEKRLLNIVMETEEKERRRLAEELHDGLGPLLSSVKMHTDMLISGKLGIDKQNQVARLIKELVGESINNLREISANLMPHVLFNYGLVSALNTLISKITAMQDIEVIFEHRKWTTRPELSLEVLIYRVLSELLTNTLKHASAHKIIIRLASQPPFLDVIYKDDGIGFNSTLKFSEQSGMGLNNILNRIKSQQGDISIKTAPGKGLHVHLNLPFES